MDKQKLAREFDEQLAEALVAFLEQEVAEIAEEQDALKRHLIDDE